MGPSAVSMMICEVVVTVAPRRVMLRAACPECLTHPLRLVLVHVNGKSASRSVMTDLDQSIRPAGRFGPASALGPVPDSYKWVALFISTLGMLMATIDGSITLIALPGHLPGHRHRPAPSPATASSCCG